MPVFEIYNIYFNGVLYHIDQIPHSQLPHEVGAVFFDRLGAHKEKSRYLLGRVALDHQPEYLLFSFGKAVVTRNRGGGLLGFKIRIDS